ncbi:MAG: hypothetical protein COA96_10130 [SAR86 cluster bacterium]|uniref:Uncharacterized protein n=1 Tax=SAR86 cluster bacterium TaxID=2030880 RepID=A0A2A5AXS8_9GAMM|nr:MAG: hypothetical protein COA96_10130 [SAR86 cluster bacterium]
MPTLQSIDGRSLVADLSRTFGNIEQAGVRGRETRREEKDITLAEQARGIGGAALPGTFPTTPSQQDRASGFLRKIAPKFADALSQLNQTRDPDGVDKLRADAEQGAVTASEILAAKTQTQKQAIILRRAEQIRQQGGDTRELLKQSGGTVAEMDLQAQKAQLTSKHALEALPAITDAERLRARAALSVRNPNALVAIQRDEAVQRQIEARQRAEARQAAAARVAAGRRAAAAKAPKTKLGKRLSDIRADISNENISAEVGNQLIADARGEAQASGIEARTPKTALGQASANVQSDLDAGVIDQEQADIEIASARAEAGAPAIEAADAEREAINAAGIRDLAVLQDIHSQGKEVYEARRKKEPDLPSFEDFPQFSRETITQLSTPTDLLAELRVNNPTLAPQITALGNAAVAVKTGDQVTWDQIVSQTGLEPLEMTQSNFQLLAGVLTSDPEAVAEAIGGEGGGDKTVATLTREQEIARIQRTQGVSEQLAAGIADGVIKTSLDPNTREMIITNLATGESRIASAEEVSATPTDTDGTPTPAVDPGSFEGAGAAFGAGGFGLNIANNLLDVVGLPPASPEVQRTVAAFDVLRENLTNTLASAYSGRVPAFLLKNIQNLTPKPASLSEGPEKAQSKLKAIDASLLRAENAADARLANRRVSPTTRSEVGRQLSALSAARTEISAALAGFSEGQNAGTTQSGIKFRIVE